MEKWARRRAQGGQRRSSGGQQEAAKLAVLGAEESSPWESSYALQRVNVSVSGSHTWGKKVETREMACKQMQSSKQSGVMMRDKRDDERCVIRCTYVEREKCQLWT